MKYAKPPLSKSRVCDEVVDRIIGEMAMDRSDSSMVVQLHLADLKYFAPSSRPFRLNDRRYFYISMHSPRPSEEGV